jgi:hypothetical protein
MTTLPHHEDFLRFHQQNPMVYDQLERLAFKLKVRGVERWGIKALWEVLRYELAIATNSQMGDFKLNNNLTASYARLLMERNPEDLAGFFETRERRRGQGVDSPDLPE